MATEEKKADEQQTPPVEPAKETENKMFPEDYVRQLREEAKARRLEAQKIKEELEALKQAELEEKGKYKELYEKQMADYEAVKKKAEEWEQYQEAQKTALIAKLPEEKRAKYEALDPKTVLAVVPDIIAQTAPVAPNPDKAKPIINGPAGKWTEEAVAKLTPEEYEEHKAEIHRDIFGG